MTENLNCGVYEIKNTTNGKRYIGSSRDVSHRFVAHKSQLNRNIHFNEHLQRAWNKYGPDSFEFTPLLFVDTEELAEFEEVAIRACESHKPENGYNKSAIGFGLESHQITEEMREEKARISKENWKDPEYREKVINSVAEANSRPEVKEKRSKKAKEFWEEMTEEEKQDFLRNSVHSSEARTKAKESCKEYWSEPENREEMSIKVRKFWEGKEKVHPEYVHSEEVNEKRSKTMKENWKDPEARARREEIAQETNNRPEKIEKYKDSMSKYWNDPEWVENWRKSMAEASTGSKYGFDKMEVNEEKAFNNEDFDLKAVKSSAHNWGKRHNMKFKCKTKGESLIVKRIK